MKKSSGFVSIIGAGPGDPDLLTLKALKALQAADVVVYDRLVSEGIMALIPQGTARIFAGKSCKQHHMTQGEINELLVSLAQSGRRVARLKGGDPFIFGRGGEEALALAAQQLPFEIIPGISSASGCSSYAGIPLTHRGLATGVRFLTGHMQDGGECSLNWASMADPDTTLVIYMGLARLELIASKLIEHGLPANTPAAAIQEGTTHSERVLVTELSRIATDVESGGLTSPTLVVIGKVVALSEQLRWFFPEPKQDTPAGIASTNR